MYALRIEVETLVKSIASDFMDINYLKVTEVKHIDPRNDTFHSSLPAIYLGMAATATIQEMKGANSSDLQTYRIHFRYFMIESILQIQNRFDLNAEIYEIVGCTHPKRFPPSIVPIFTKLPYLHKSLNINDLDQEWRHNVFENIDGEKQ